MTASEMAISEISSIYINMNFLNRGYHLIKLIMIGILIIPKI
jgi:hypothetical protein